MILSFLAPLWGFMKGVPREVWYGIAAVLLFLWIANAQYDRGYQARSVEYERAAREAQERARAADQSAGETVATTRNDTEQGNEQARQAADGSDDPLRSGFDSLRP